MKQKRTRALSTNKTGVLARIPKTVKHGFLAVFLPLLLARIIPGGENVAIIYCIFHAAKGCRQGIEALLTVFLLLMAGSAWGVTGLINDIRWVVLIAAVFSVIRALSMGDQLRKGVSNLILVITIYAVVNLLIGLQVSRYPTISSFKLISFWIGSCTLLISFNFARESKVYWSNWFTGWFSGLIFCGLLCLLWGGGFSRNGVGFEGALGHPQTNGVVMGTAAAFFLSQYLLRKKAATLEGLLGVVCIVFVYLSQSRTGFFAFILGGGLMTALLWFKYGGKLAQTRLFKNSLITGMIVFVGMVALPNQIGSMMEEFVAKGSESVSDIGAAFAESREELVERSMKNFRENKMLGIGFGVPSSEFANVKTLMGLPVGASVEKGFMPTAILEETGIVGALLFTVLILAIFGVQIKVGNPTFLWPMSTIILTNLGEAMFFSIGGLGMFLWAMIGLAVAEEKPRMKKKKKRLGRGSESSELREKAMHEERGQSV